VALRFAVRQYLIGLLVAAGVLWLSAPHTGAWAVEAAGARAVPAPISLAFPDAVFDPDGDSESRLAALHRLLWGGEDEESSKALAPSFESETNCGTDPGRQDADARLALYPAFLSPFKTGPPTH
jgi:hypothetical protein